MKKSLLVLCAVLTLAVCFVFSSFGVTAEQSDASDITGISVVEGTVGSFIENDGGYWEEVYDHENDTFVDRYYYRYETVWNDALVELTFADGHTETIEFYNNSYDFYFALIHNQYKERWSVGGNNTVEVILYLEGRELKTQYNVQVLESPLDRIEVVSGTGVQLIENYNGTWEKYYDDETQEDKVFFEYNIRPLIRSLRFNLVYKNGETKTAGLWDYVDGYSFGWDDGQWHKHWTRGGDNFLNVFIMGKSVDVPVEIGDSPVEKLELVGSPKSFFEGYDQYEDAYYDEETQEYISYYRYREFAALETTKLKVVFKDGSEEIYSTVDGNTPAFDITCESDQYNNPWKIGKDNVIKVSYMGVTIDVNVELKEFPVKKIEVVADSVTPLIENVHGHDSVWYNEETETEEMFFCYEIGYALESVRFNVTYSDGREETVSAYGMGYDAEWRQHQKPWGIGVHTLEIDVRIPDGSGQDECEVEMPVTVDITVKENPIEKIELKEGTLKFFYENTNGNFEEIFDEESGQTKKVFIYDYSMLLDGAVFIITNKDGTTEEFTFRFEDETRFFDSWCNQEDEPWSVGENNPFTVKYMGKEVELYATIAPNPIERIEVVKDTVSNLIENSDGYWESYWDDQEEKEVTFFCYHASNAFENAEFKVIYTDGREEVIRPEWCDIQNGQFEKPWGLGENDVEVGFVLDELGMVWTSASVKVVENPVASIEVEEGTEVSLIENSGGYYDTYYDEEEGKEVRFYCYEADGFLQGVRVKITYKNGETKTVYVHEWVDGREIEWDTNQYESPWTIGGENIVTLRYMGAVAQYNVVIKPSPVLSIEVDESTLTSLVEGVNCDKAWYYDEETDEEKSYYLYGYSNAFDRAKIKVNYKNGETGYIYCRFQLEGQGVELDSNQSVDNQWKVGGNNKVTVSYLGASDTVDIVIKPNPVKKIEIVNGTVLPFINGCYGCIQQEYDHETGEPYEFFYYFIDSVEKTAKVKVYFEDGTTKIMTGTDTVDGFGLSWYTNQYHEPWTVGGDNVLYAEFMGREASVSVEIIESPLESFTVTEAGFRRYIYGDVESGYFSEEGFVLYKVVNKLSFNVKYKDGRTFEYSYDPANVEMIFDGYTVEVDSANETAVIGKNTFIFTYMGLTSEVEVEVSESPVEYIKLIKAPLKTDYENIKVGFNDFRILPVFDGIDFEIKFKDGRVIKASEYTEEAWYESSSYCLLIEDEILYVTRDDDGFVAYYLGASCKVDCINYTETLNISKVEIKKFSKDGNGMVVTLHYGDGTSEDVTLETLEVWGDESDSLDGLAKCSKGVIDFYIINAKMDNIYAVYIFDTMILVTYEDEVITGDADGNGIVDSDDAIHLLYNVLFGDAYELTQKCDFDGSGTVDSDDAIHLLYHVLFGADSYPLKN